MSNTRLYEQDFYAWANEQAGLLRAGRMSAADIEHIADEIDSMGKSERRELVSRLTVLLVHLLKWQNQPVMRSRSWSLALEEQRNCIEDHLADNRSLKSGLEEVMVAAYRNAIPGAARETGFDRDAFPVTCPWTFDLTTDPNFYPEATN